MRNFRSYAASNLATVDAPGCDYFVLRKNPSVLYICQLRMFFMRRRWRVYVVEGEYVQNVWYIISAWAILLFVQQYRALSHGLRVWIGQRTVHAFLLVSSSLGSKDTT